jgi:hypothetical protein
MLALIAIARISRQVPGLRRVPVLQILLLVQIGLLVREHIERLTPRERRRIVILFRDARGWPPNLPPSQRDEIERLFQKTEPRLLADAVAEMAAPFRLAERLIRR